MLPKITGVRDYLDTLSFLIVASAGNFPKFKPFDGDLISNNRLVLQLLADGLPVVAARLKDESKMARIRELLDSARAAFEKDDRHSGVRALDEIANVISPDRYKNSAKS